MYEGWSSKTTVGDDIIRCTIFLSSVVFRYHTGWQNLCVNFYFTRDKAVGRKWVPLEHERDVPLVSLSCEVINHNPPLVLQFNVGTHWPILHLWYEVQISMGHAVPTEFAFIIAEVGKDDKKVNTRKECKSTMADVLPPHSLKLKVFDLWRQKAAFYERRATSESDSLSRILSSADATSIILRCDQIL